MVSRIQKYKLGRGNGSFAKWFRSAVADYIHFLLLNASRIAKEDIVFFDVEFYPSKGKNPKARLVVWHETRPPKGSRKYNIVWSENKCGRQRFINALYRARYVVGYNSRELDFPALKKWGLDDRKVLLKLIDLYEFIFFRLSYNGTASLDYISKLNGGLGKYHRKDASKPEFQKQCQRDVKILEHLFWKVLSGEFETPRFGHFNSEKIWFDLPEKETKKAKERSISANLSYFPRKGGVPA